MVSAVTVQPIEVVWVLCALAGLVMWLLNLYTAIRSRRATRSVPDTSGVRIWAKFSVLATSGAVMIETCFILVGLVAMSVPAAPTGNPVRSLAIAVMFVVVSLVVTVVGYRWRWVDVMIMRLATAEHGDSSPDVV